MSANVFTDPRTADTYSWPRNHAPDGADETALTRSVEHSATTSGTSVVRQQGALEPMTLSRSGIITTDDMHNRMVAWAKLGQAQTIYFTDACAGQFEVIVTSFASRPESLGSQTIWRYTLEMEVVDVLSGTWDSTDPTP